MHLKEILTHEQCQICKIMLNLLDRIIRGTVSVSQNPTSSLFTTYIQRITNKESYASSIKNLPCSHIFILIYIEMWDLDSGEAGDLCLHSLPSPPPKLKALSLTWDNDLKVIFSKFYIRWPKQSILNQVIQHTIIDSTLLNSIDIS